MEYAGLTEVSLTFFSVDLLGSSLVQTVPVLELSEGIWLPFDTIFPLVLTDRLFQDLLEQQCSASLHF